MSDVRKVTEGAVTSISDSDLVMCSVGGTYHPISFSSLMAAVRGGIRIGGRNLLKGSYNGGPGWSQTPSDGVFQIAASSSEVFLHAPQIPLEIGKTYTVSVTAKATPNITSMDIWLCAVINGPMIASVKLSDEWTRYSYSISVKASHRITGGVFRIDNNGSTNGQQSILWVKEIKVEEGNIATGWSLAPEDIASGVCGGGNWLSANHLRFEQERRCA